MPLVEVEGVDRRHCDAWRDDLSTIDDDLVVWGRLSQRRVGASPIAAVADEDMATDQDDVDAIVSDWDDEDDSTEEQTEAVA